MPVSMPMQMPQGGQPQMGAPQMGPQAGGMMPAPQQNPLSNPQLFAQLLQQMGAAPPNLQGPGQTPMPGQGGQMPQMGPMQGGQMPPMGPGNAGQPPQAGQPPMGGAGGPAQLPPQLQQMIQQQMMQRMAQTQGSNRMGQPAQQNRFTPQELGALGRMGDTTVAHLTPGEMTVPPQVQTPKVLATLKSEYHKKGVDPSQFTVGSPNSSVNPSTGVPEYNFWSSVLPMALGVGGSLLMPGIGTALGMGMSPLLAGAVGGGLGTTLGGILGGQSPMDALTVGGLSGIGAYGLGSLLGPAAEGAESATKVANNAVNPITGGLGGSMPLNGAQMGGSSAGLDKVMSGLQPEQTLAQQASAAVPAGQSAYAAQSPGMLDGIFGSGNGAASMTTGQRLGSLAGGSLGSMVGNSIVQANNNPPLPKGFNTPYKSAGELPSWQQQIGQTGYKGPTPNFTGYNPLTNNPSAYNFFPTGG